MMTVYSNKKGTSPYSRKGLIVLEEKGLPYEKLNTDPEHLPEGFGKLNPNLRVSVLIDGDKHIFESDNIVDYLLRTYPGSKPPPGEPPLAESMTRPDRHIEDAMTLETIETILDCQVHLMFVSRAEVDAAQLSAPASWVWERHGERIQSCLDWLEQRATPEGFVPGVFSVMDIKLICTLAQNEQFGRVGVKGFPYSWQNRKNLAALYDRFQSRPSVHSTGYAPT